MNRHHLIATAAVVALALLAAHVGCEPRQRPVSSALCPHGCGLPAGHAAVSQSAHTLPDDSFVLLITGHTNGNLEPCNCPGQPLGGLSRRKTLLDSLVAQYRHCVLLDNGNSVMLTPDPIADRYIIQGIGRIGYHAVVVGDQELDRGPDVFLAAAQEARLPLVGTNLRLIDGRPFGQSYRTVRCRQRTVLVVGVVGPRVLQLSPAEVRQQLDVLDPADAVAKAIEQAGADGVRPDLIVLLANVDPGEREPLLARLKGVVDLAVLSNERDRPVQLEQVAEVPVVYTPSMGRHVAAVICQPSDKPAEAAGGRRFAVSRAVGHPVAQQLARDTSLWEHYQAYTYDAEQHSLKLLGRVGKISYVPSADCGACHVTQMEWWRKQPHGQAWATIVREGRTRDPSCMRCHTTGYGYAGGFRTAGESLALADVGCQSCHQVDPGPHKLANPPKNVPKVDTLTCRGCHTEPKSPNFDITVYGPKATCPKGKPVATQPQ